MLYYYEPPHHDKFYEIGIYRDGEIRGAPTFKVICRYGRRCAAGKEEIKTPQPVYNGEAYDIAERIEREKRAKGYRDGATEYAPRSDSEAQRLRGEQLLREVMAPSYTLRARPADARPAFTPPRDNGIRLERPARRAATPPPAPKPVFTSPLKSKRAYRLEDE